MIKLGLQNMPPLPDLSFSLLPEPAWWPKSAADLAMFTFIAVSFMACCISARLNKGDSVIFVLIYVRRFLWLLGFCYLLRLCTLGGTTLPASTSSCLMVKRTFWEYFTTGPLVILGMEQTCTDKLFSGHTVLATLLIWFWMATFWTKAQRWEKILFRTYALLHGSSIFIASMMSRHHYTVDVVLAIIIGTLVFHIYHLIIWIKEGYDRGLSYFSIRYGGGPTELYRTHHLSYVEPSTQGIIGSSEKQPSEAETLETGSMDSKFTTRKTAPRMARLAFGMIGWAEGLDLRD